MDKDKKIALIAGAWIGYSLCMGCCIFQIRNLTHRIKSLENVLESHLEAVYQGAIDEEFVSIVNENLIDPD